MGRVGPFCAIKGSATPARTTSRAASLGLKFPSFIGRDPVILAASVNWLHLPCEATSQFPAACPILPFFRCAKAAIPAGNWLSPILGPTEPPLRGSFGPHDIT